MNTRSFLMVNLLQAAVASSATSTAAGSAVDLANYFPVGKREIKFVIGAVLASTTTGFQANVTIQENDSTATASFTNVGDALLTTDGTHTLTEAHRFVSKRFVRILYNTAQATSGNTINLVAMAFPIVRAG